MDPLKIDGNEACLLPHRNDFLHNLILVSRTLWIPRNQNLRLYVDFFDPSSDSVKKENAWIASEGLDMGKKTETKTPDDQLMMTPSMSGCS